MPTERPSCGVGKHVQLHKPSADLWWCPVCAHYLADQDGTIDYGSKRPRGPAWPRPE